MADTQRHQEASAVVSASAEQVFALLDDQQRLAAHMSRRSLMMGGGRMSYEFDAERGQAVGSHIRASGSAFGLRVFLDEVVTERIPGVRKVWRTVGEPRLIVVGPYEMGFKLTPLDAGARLTVWIDYALPSGRFARRFPALADGYARWCVEQMVRDAAAAFAAA